MYRCIEALAGEQGTDGDEGHDAAYGEQRNDEYRTPVLSYDGGIYHHADGYEEDGSEQVLDAGYKMLDVLSFNRFRQYGTHHEGSQRSGEPDCCGQGYHAEAESYGDDQEYLVVHVFTRLLEQRGNDEYAHQEPQYDEESELCKVPDHF